MRNPKDYLENCNYISQDDDTVYIDEEALEECMSQYTNQKIIEELKNLQIGLPTGTDGTLMYIRINKRIKELKHQD